MFLEITIYSIYPKLIEKTLVKIDYIEKMERREIREKWPETLYFVMYMGILEMLERCGGIDHDANFRYRVRVLDSIDLEKKEKTPNFPEFKNVPQYYSWLKGGK